MMWGRVVVVQVEVTDGLGNHSDVAIHVLTEREKEKNLQSAISQLRNSPFKPRRGSKRSPWYSSLCSESWKLVHPTNIYD